MNNQAAQTMPERPEFSVDEALRIADQNADAYDKVASVSRTLAAEVRRLAALSQTAGVPSWIVNDLGELGVMVNGVAYFLYKGDNIVYEDAKHDDGSPMLYRMVGKREFGEVCRPRHWEENGWAVAHRYTQELVYTPGLSFGKPNDGDWRPLPANAAAPAASGGESSTGASVSERDGGSPHCIGGGNWSPWDLFRLSTDMKLPVNLPAEKAMELRRDIERAIEQALTQQRGECVAEVVAIDPVSPFDHRRNWSPDRTLVWSSKLDGLGCLNLPVGTKLYTTPQPCAEALRELVATWRKRAERKRIMGLTNEALLDEAHANELESLLARGG